MKRRKWKIFSTEERQAWKQLCQFAPDSEIVHPKHVWLGPYHNAELFETHPKAVASFYFVDSGNGKINCRKIGNSTIPPVLHGESFLRITPDMELQHIKGILRKLQPSFERYARDMLQVLQFNLQFGMRCSNFFIPDRQENEIKEFLIKKGVQTQHEHLSPDELIRFLPRYFLSKMKWRKKERKSNPEPPLHAFYYLFAILFGVNEDELQKYIKKYPRRNHLPSVCEKCDNKRRHLTPEQIEDLRTITMGEKRWGNGSHVREVLGRWYPHWSMLKCISDDENLDYLPFHVSAIKPRRFQRKKRPIFIKQRLKFFKKHGITFIPGEGFSVPLDSDEIEEWNEYRATALAHED